MNHNIDEACYCSIFENKNMNLKILAIHRILVQIEDFFMKNRNFDGLIPLYQDPWINKFTFYVRVSIFHMSQRKSQIFITEDNLNHLIETLKYFCYSDKILFISIEMLSEKLFQHLKSYYFANIKNVHYECF